MYQFKCSSNDFKSRIDLDISKKQQRRKKLENINQLQMEWNDWKRHLGVNNLDIILSKLFSSSSWHWKSFSLGSNQRDLSYLFL